MKILAKFMVIAMIAALSACEGSGVPPTEQPALDKPPLTNIKPPPGGGGGGPATLDGGVPMTEASCKKLLAEGTMVPKDCVTILVNINKEKEKKEEEKKKEEKKEEGKKEDKKEGAPQGESTPTKEEIQACTDLQAAGKPLTEECTATLKKFGAMISAASAVFSKMGESSGATMGNIGNSINNAFNNALGGAAKVPTDPELSDLCPDVKEIDAQLLSAIRKKLDLAPTDAIRLTDAAKLKSLEVKDAKITSLKGLGCFMSLELLSVSGNQIESIEPLKMIMKLISLDISANKLTDLTPLQFHPSLAVLNISKNPVSSLGALSGLKKLIGLYANDIPNLDSLKPIVDLPGLAGNLVSVKNNPKLPLCEILELQQKSKTETYDQFCPNADPKDKGCGECGDYGIECNTKVENVIPTTVEFNRFTPCTEDKIAGLELEITSENNPTVFLQMSVKSSIPPMKLIAGKPTSVKVWLPDSKTFQQLSPLEVDFKSETSAEIQTIKVRAILTSKGVTPEVSVLMSDVCVNHEIGEQAWTYKLVTTGPQGNVVSCPPVPLKFAKTCPFTQVNIGLSVSQTGLGSGVSVSLMSKVGAKLAHSSWYGVNGKAGPRNISAALIADPACLSSADASSDLAQVVVRLTDSGFLDMGYAFQSLSIMNGLTTVGQLVSGALTSGFVDGDYEDETFAYPSQFGGTPQPTNPYFGK